MTKKERAAIHKRRKDALLMMIQHLNHKIEEMIKL
jgi:hypothetical protein